MFRTDRIRHYRCGASTGAIVLAAVALVALVIAHGEINAAPRPGLNSAKLAGAFVNWGAAGRENTLQIWEKWLRQQPSSVLGVDFYGDSTWEDYSKLSWVPGIWKRL